MTIVMPLFLLFVLGILLLCVEMWALLNPTSRRLASGVGLWSPHFFVLNFFKSRLTLNPHNKQQTNTIFVLIVNVHLFY